MTFVDGYVFSRYRCVVTNDFGQEDFGDSLVRVKYRYGAAHRKKLLASRWWQFAPWQLGHLDFDDPDLFCEGVAAMDRADAFQPDVFVV